MYFLTVIKLKVGGSSLAESREELLRNALAELISRSVEVVRR
jgi:hypothetical protein